MAEPVQTATTDLAATERDPWKWCTTLYPRTYAAPWASYHAEFWRWVWALTAGQSATPFVSVWPRGFAKSTNAEAAVVAVGARATRHYCLYISGTQEQANNHVQSIGQRMTGQDVYRGLAERMVNKYGSSMGWRRDRLWTADGFIVDALGLDTAIRGIKLGDQRPDFIILDDIDAADDSPTTIDRKVVALTRGVLPARSPDCAVLVAQNLIHADGIVTRLVDGRADFLTNRTVSGPWPAIKDMEWERVDGRSIVTKGEPTWPGVMTLDVLQATIDEIGMRAFLAELQHEVELAGTPRFSPDVIAEMRRQVRLPLSQEYLRQRAPWAAGITGLRVYSLPSPTANYVAYTDPAEGKGHDNMATACGIPRANGKGVDLAWVLEDTDREPTAHASIVVDLLEHYGLPLWGIERAKGEAVFQVAGARQYSRLYWHEDTAQTNLQRMAGRPVSLRPGFPMTASTKRGLIDAFAADLESMLIGCPDERTLDELGTYVIDAQGRTNAVAGGQDGLVIALAGLRLMASQPLGTDEPSGPVQPSSTGW